MIILACAILWCVYASLEGLQEARHFYYRISSSLDNTYNEHGDYFAHRLVAFVPFAFIMFDINNLFTLINGFCLAAMFPFWHDGYYYWKRNKMKDGTYPFGFWSPISTTSTSWWDRKGLTSPKLRITYFVIGMCGLIIINYFK